MSEHNTLIAQQQQSCLFPNFKLPTTMIYAYIFISSSNILLCAVICECLCVILIKTLWIFYKQYSLIKKNLPVYLRYSSNIAFLHSLLPCSFNICGGTNLLSTFLKRKSDLNIYTNYASSQNIKKLFLRIL